MYELPVIRPEPLVVGPLAIRPDYHVCTMVSRNDLKVLIEQLPESSLDRIRQILEYHLHPPETPPEITRMQERSRSWRETVLERFRETGKPGTIRGMGGGGSLGVHQGTPFGRQGFHYWDGNALVHQTLQFFDDHEIEVMERLSLSPDGATLICDLEISSARGL